MRDLDSVRSFLGGLGPVALFDLPWMPVYLGICFAFHFWIGMTATIGAFILIILTILTEWLALKPTKTAAKLAQSRNAMIEWSRRNSEALVAMGMVPHLTGRWSYAQSDYLASNRRASDAAGGFGAISKVLRHDAAIGRARGRRVSRHLSSKPRPESSSPARSSARARWRPSISPSPIGAAGLRRGKAGIGSSRLLAMVPPESEPMPLQPPHKSLVGRERERCAAGCAKAGRSRRVADAAAPAMASA